MTFQADSAFQLKSHLKLKGDGVGKGEKKKLAMGLFEIYKGFLRTMSV